MTSDQNVSRPKLWGVWDYSKSKTRYTVRTFRQLQLCCNCFTVKEEEDWCRFLQPSSTVWAETDYRSSSQSSFSVIGVPWKKETKRNKDTSSMVSHTKGFFETAELWLKLILCNMPRISYSVKKKKSNHHIIDCIWNGLFYIKLQSWYFRQCTVKRCDK